MKFLVVSPARVQITEVTGDERSRLEQFLTYTSKTAQYELRRHQHSPWFANQHGQEAYYERLNELKKAVKVCLLQEQPLQKFMSMINTGDCIL